MAEARDKKKKMPKGGRKGGTVFPRINLDDALGYARKLVSKTHTGPQPAANVLVGVVGAKGPVGQVRISALKQYGLLSGTPQGYSATALAKQIAAHSDDEELPFIQKACANPKVFATLLETFHGDTTTKAKMRARLSSEKVHPDQLEQCVEFFVSSVATARLGTVAGDQVTIFAKTSSDTGKSAATAAETQEEKRVQDDAQSSEPGAGAPGDECPPNGHEIASDPKGDGGTQQQTPPASAASGKPHVTLSISVDSTMDPDKLAKQLELLKRFGAL